MPYMLPLLKPLYHKDWFQLYGFCDYLLIYFTVVQTLLRRAVEFLIILM